VDDERRRRSRRRRLLLPAAVDAGSGVGAHRARRVECPAGAAGDDLYIGHVFSIGVQKLRLLAHLAGLRIRKLHHHTINGTSLVLFPLCYSLILLGVDLRVLLAADLFVEFEKTPAQSRQCSSARIRRGPLDGSSTRCDARAAPQRVAC
jgi:hypothetical protein